MPPRGHVTERLPWRGVIVGHEHGVAINTAIAEPEARRLEELADGRHILEVGSAYGYSACVMGRRGAMSIIAVDPHHAIPVPATTGAVMEANLVACGVRDKVTMVRELSGTVLPRYIADGRKFGLIFIDGDHTAGAAREDARLSVQLLEPGGILLFHDYGNPECPDVAPVLDDMFPGGPDRVTVSLWEKSFP
jgi:protein-L-isoaspartate O-methyltransferase